MSSREIGGHTAQTSSSSVVKLLRVPRGLDELLLRERRRRGWTQQQLAHFCGVRTQTVSAWERGNPPQRRFFGKIADFLGAADEEAVAVLVVSRSTSDEELSAGEQVAPSASADLQTRTVETILRQLDIGGRPTSAQVKLYRALLVAAKQPVSRQSEELDGDTAGSDSVEVSPETPTEESALRIARASK